MVDGRFLWFSIIVATLSSCSLLSAGRPEPSDRADQSPRITHIRGAVYLVEDLNYWKTNSVFYAAPDGIVFFDATYTLSSAARVLWKAAVLSDARYVGLILTGHELHRSGGIAAFEREEVPIYLQVKTATALRKRWDAMHVDMAAQFGSWRKSPFAGPDGVFEDHIEILGGRIRVIFPGSAHSPGNLIVYFPDERILYAGSMLSDPLYFLNRAEMTGYEKLWPVLRSLPAEIYVSGHGEALRGPELVSDVMGLVRRAVQESATTR